jgi:uncharacterized protein involved in exopolysaccharide biosynthesis
MPEQRESNLARLNSLHEQYQGTQDSIQDLERTKVMVQEQINLRKRLASLGGGATLPAGTAQPSGVERGQPESPWQRLQRLRSHLEALQVKYTDKHPAVRRTKHLIAKLEADLEGQKAPSGSTRKVRRQVQDPEIAQLQIQQKEISMNIKNLKADQEKIRSEITKYEQWIAAAPIREAEWNTLTRDYDELRRHYDYLVAQNLQASSVEHLERKQKGSKFKIVDPAHFPDKPFKPDFMRIMLIAVAGGLGLGVGGVLAVDFIDTTFKDTDDLENYLDLPVISSIPYLERYDEITKLRIKKLIWGLSLLLYTVILLAVMFYFWRQGRIII